MLARPQVSVFSSANANEIVGQVTLPGVFRAPIRNDIVHFVHYNLAKNLRQAHGVNVDAGMQHSAESWGTGRAVARIPRVGGSGTSRSGQAAFGNQVRKGRMFAPLKVWRRWHRKVNVTQKRHAIASALAASSWVPLVLARGHRVEQIPELPLVIDDKLESIEKTRDIIDLLRRFKAYADSEKVSNTIKLRAGKGKLRNRRYRQRKGPLFIYSNENAKFIKAARNVAGVELCNVHRLNLKLLAPGGQLGRFCIWTQSAFRALDRIFGSYRKRGQEKKNYQLQRPSLQNPDLARLINSNEIQSVVRRARRSVRKHEIQKKNPLRNQGALHRLNPHAKVLHELNRKQNQENAQKRQAELKAGRGASKSLSAAVKKQRKAQRRASKAWLNGVFTQLDEASAREKETYVNLAVN